MVFVLKMFILGVFYAHSSFTVQTENTELKNELEKLIQNVESKEDAQEKIENYLDANSYFTSNVDFNQYFTITNPIQWEIFFKGNTNYSKYFLKTKLKDYNYSKSLSSFTAEAKIQLTKIYKSMGYHFISVNHTENKDRKNFIYRVIFSIKEGPIVKIDDIQFIGKYEPFSKKYLSNKLNLYAGSQISKDIFFLEALESGVVSLRNDFNNLGYFKTEIDLKETLFTEDKKKVLLTIEVNINEPTRIKSIKFVGNNNTSSSWLTTLLNLYEGEILNLYTLEDGLGSLEQYYLERGFLNVKVFSENILQYSKDLLSVEILIPIDEGKQIIVSKINLLGLKKTKPSVIRRTLTFNNGEVLTAHKINTTINDLTRLGFLSNISITPDTTQPDSTGAYPVDINLKERKSGNFTTGFSVSTVLDLTFTTFAGLDYKNIAGTGRALSTRAEVRKNIKVNYLENRVFLSYLEPFLFNTDDIKGKVNLSRSDEIWDVTTDKSTGNDLVTVILSNRLDLILERNLSPRTTMYFSVFSLDLRKEEIIGDQFNLIRENIGSFGPLLEFDYRNHPFLPTKGFFSRVQFEYSTPFFGSSTEISNIDSTKKYDLEFARLQGSHTLYKKLSNSLHWAQSFRGGYLHNFPEANSGAPFPKSRAFFLGGSSTIRGFDPSDPNERIPGDYLLNLDSRNRILSIPSTSYYYLTKSELRFPLAPGSSWWGALFYDGGGVQIAGNQYSDFDPWRHSVGIGVRLNTPVGPLLNLEIAYKLDRKEREDSIGFHLSVSSF